MKVSNFIKIKKKKKVSLQKSKTNTMLICFYDSEGIIQKNL